MTRQLKRVQGEFKDDANFRILSHTVNPSIDSAEVLFRYARKFEVDDENWWFLTGSKKDLYLMARRSYLVVPDEADPNFKHGEESDFIHTENFVLVDPDKRIRGMYDGTNESEVSAMIRDIYDLKKEYGFK
jgi:protein SCO1/2